MNIQDVFISYGSKDMVKVYRLIDTQLGQMSLWDTKCCRKLTSEGHKFSLKFDMYLIFEIFNKISP